MKKIILFSIIALFICIIAFFSKNKSDPSVDPEKELTVARTEQITKEHKIGFITDIHGKKIGKNKTGLNKQASVTLSYFINKMNSDFRPAFIVQGGDLIEGNEGEKSSFEDFKVLFDYFKNTNVPVYHVIGNHDTRGLSKENWLDFVGYEKSFYFFDYDDLRIVIMDGNEHEKAKTENYTGDFYYISQEQFFWLEKTLSENKNLKKLVFIHYPPFVDRGNRMLDPNLSKKIREIFARNKVLAVFSGHTERLDFQEIEGVRYFTLPGVEKSKNKDILWLESFAEITLEKEVWVKLFYKKNHAEEYRTLLIPSEEYDQIEK